MAGFRSARPLGLFDEPPSPAGIAPGAGYLFAGAGALHDVVASDGGAPLERFLARPGGLTFQVGATTYRLRRVDQRARPQPEETPVPAAESRSILERASGTEAASLLPLLSTALFAWSGTTGSLGLFRLRPWSPAAPPDEPLPLPLPKAKPPAPKKELSWVEIHFQNESGEPISGQRYRLELPDKSVREGLVPKGGVLRLDGIDPGSCRLSMVELDAADWSVA